MGGLGFAFYGVTDAAGQLDLNDLALGFGVTVGGGIHLTELWTLSLALGKASVKWDGMNEDTGQAYQADRFGFWHLRAAINILSR